MSREIQLVDALNNIVSLVVEFMQCDACLLYLLQDQELVLCSSNNPRPDIIGRVRLKLGEGLTGWVARERRLLSVSSTGRRWACPMGPKANCYGQVCVERRLCCTPTSSR